MKHVIEHLETDDELREAILASDGRRQAKQHVRDAGLEPASHVETMAHMKALRDDHGYDISLALAATLADC